jgi:aminopeptidase N
MAVGLRGRVDRVTSSATAAQAAPNNLTRDEAAERARLLTVASYDVELDLTDGAGAPGEGTFLSRSTSASPAPSPARPCTWT